MFIWFSMDNKTAVRLKSSTFWIIYIYSGFDETVRNIIVQFKILATIFFKCNYKHNYIENSTTRCVRIDTMSNRSITKRWVDKSNKKLVDDLFNALCNGYNNRTRTFCSYYKSKAVSLAGPLAQCYLHHLSFSLAMKEKQKINVRCFQ